MWIESQDNKSLIPVSHIQLLYFDNNFNPNTKNKEWEIKVNLNYGSFPICIYTTEDKRQKVYDKLKEWLIDVEKGRTIHVIFTMPKDEEVEE